METLSQPLQTEDGRQVDAVIHPVSQSFLQTVQQIEQSLPNRRLSQPIQTEDGLKVVAQTVQQTEQSQTAQSQTNRPGKRPREGPTCSETSMSVDGQSSDTAGCEARASTGQTEIHSVVAEVVLDLPDYEESQCPPTP